MVRFLFGILVGIFIGAGGALKLPDLNFKSSSEAIKDGVKEVSKEIIKEELEAQKKRARRQRRRAGRRNTKAAK